MNTTDRRRLFTEEQRVAERAYKRSHYRKTRDAQLEYARNYRDKNRDAQRQRDRNPSEARKAYLKEYNRKNAERIRARRAKWTEANSERIAAVDAAWTQNNLTRHRLKEHKRRARLKAGGTLSMDIIEKLLVKQNGRCACCNQRLQEGYHLDHIVPLAKGGRNVDDNVQLLLPRCNRQKGAMDPIAFMQRERGMLL